MEPVPVSTTEFQQAIGEIRRRGDERHTENQQRMQALEIEFRAHAKEDLLAMAKIDKSITHNTDLTRAALNAANETKKSVQGFVDAAQVGRTFKKYLITTAAIGTALTTLGAIILFLMGKLPYPL